MIFKEDEDGREMVTEDEKRVLRGAEQVYTGMKVHYGTIMRLIISS